MKDDIKSTIFEIVGLTIIAIILAYIFMGGMQ